MSTFATNQSATRTRLVTGALVVGVSLLGLTACELPTSSTVVRSSSATPVDKNTTTTSVPATSTTAPAPASSAPPILLPMPTTAPAPATTLPAPLPAAVPPVEVPAGSLDLGNGVFVPVSVGWTGTLSNGIVELSDGTVDVLLQVLRRQPGEDPEVVVDEHVASAIDPVGTVNSGPVTMRWSTETHRPAMGYGFFYTSFDPAAADGKGIAGGVSVFIRDVGLTLIYDVWAPAAVEGALAGDSFNAMIDSFLFAPEAAVPAALAVVPDFRVATASDTALVGPLSGFTAAPGFVVQAAEPEYALAASATAELAVVRSTGRTDEVDALANGMAIVLGVLPEAQFGDDETFDDPDGLGIARSSITFAAGARSGWVAVFFDTTTGNAYSIVAVWDGVPGAAPDVAAASFMLHSMANSFTTIV